MRLITRWNLQTPTLDFYQSVFDAEDVHRMSSPAAKSENNSQNAHFNANCITRGPFSALMT
jgi:hypothetical protein